MNKKKTDRKQLTGEDIHAAFVYASVEPDRPPLADILTEWNGISSLKRERYRRMAIHLNAFLTEEEQSHGD